jgi:tetratricopeptide (TPR) repeat protein
VPSWCRWGYYCWPAYYCWYYPRYWDWCLGSSWWSSSYVFHWDSHHVARHCVWYWPSRVYAPSIVYGYDDPYYDGGSSAHVTAYAGPAPGADLAPARPAPATLAERHVDLGDFYFTEGRYEDAAESYLRALAYVPEDASVHFALADALFALGDYHYSAFMVGKALELEPAMATVVADKREFYGDPKDFAAQMETLRRYLRDKPYDAAAHLLLGYNLRMSADPAGARDAFARVLEIDKRNVAATLFVAALDAEAARAKEAAPDAGDRRLRKI